METEEMIPDKIIKNNKNQIGFSKGLGCELNLLKLQQKIQYWKDSSQFNNRIIATIHLDI